MHINIHESRHSVFHPIEHIHIQSYLNSKYRIPDGMTLESLFPELGLDESHEHDPNSLQIGYFFEKGLEGPTNNAVARLILETVEKRLPSFILYDVLTNTYTSPRPTESKKRGPNDVKLLPIFLFEINWATGYFGVTWPEIYHLGYLPEYDRYIVTASQDSGDCYGFCDICIGHFLTRNDPFKQALEVISKWWKKDEYCEYFEELIRTGALNEKEIRKAADSVWPQ